MRICSQRGSLGYFSRICIAIYNSGSVFFLLAAAGCSKLSTENSKDNLLLASPAIPTPLFVRGRAIYQANCIACHNSDPTKAGAIGPELKGSTKDLLEARVLRGEYPAGYAPKRSSKAMPSLPHLKNELEGLAEYLK